HELETRALAQISEVEGVGEELAETIFRLGWRSVTDVARAIPEELAQVPGVGTVEGSRAVIEAARRFLEGDREQRRRDEAAAAAAAAEAAAQAPTPAPADPARPVDEGWNG